MRIILHDGIISFFEVFKEKEWSWNLSLNYTIIDVVEKNIVSCILHGNNQN